MGKLCNLARFLAEEELSCRRMERAAGPDTAHGWEWHRIAETLCALRMEHVGRCERCGKDK